MCNETYQKYIKFLSDNKDKSEEEMEVLFKEFIDSLKFEEVLYITFLRT